MNNKNHTLFLEFNGLSGSGKTTLCNEIVHSLRNDGNTVIYFGDYRLQFKRTITNFFYIIFGALLRGHFVTIMQYFALLFLLPKQSPDKLKNVFFALYEHLLILKCYEGSNANIIISDQGIVQNIVSCFFHMPIKRTTLINNIFNRLDRDIPCFVPVNMSISYLLAMNRIEKRLRKNSRLQRMERDTATKTAKIQAENFTFLRDQMNCFQSLSINAEDSITNNVILVSKYLYEAMNDDTFPQNEK